MLRTCKKCGKKFEGGKNINYCPNCRHVKVKVKCHVCGKEFILSKSQHKNWLYHNQTEFLCSRKCISNVPQEKVCEHCGKKFIGAPKTRYCQHCLHDDIYVKCNTCGKEFKLSEGQRRQWLNGRTKFVCGIKCSKAFNTERKCVKCGKKFLGQPQQKLCPSCIKRKRIAVCKVCGKEYERHHSGEYCDECTNKEIKVKCAACGKEFVLSKRMKYEYYAGKRTFVCSKKCAVRIPEKKICAHCGKEFMGTKSHKYCDHCRNDDIWMECASCGKKFKLSKKQRQYWLRGEQTKFVCCPACQLTMKYTKICKKCGKEFEGCAKDHYCDECKNNPVMVKCASCGKEFVLSESQHYEYLRGQELFYCSTRCANGKMEYCEQCGKDTFHDRNGICMVCSNWFIEHQDEIEQTMMERYGASNPSNIPEFVEKRNKTFENNFIGGHPGRDPNVAKKAHATIRANGGNSKLELLVYNELISNGLVENEDFFWQYNDNDLYPFNCDFYFPKLKLYLEINGYWMHGTHTFNKRAKRDQEKLADWEKRAKDNEGGQYRDAIKTWTERDPKKVRTAKRNNLNYLILWNKKEIIEWLDQQDFSKYKVKKRRKKK